MFQGFALFLSSLFRTPSAVVVAGHTAPFCLAAIRAELDYLPDADASQITLDLTGGFVVVDGFANSHPELNRLMDTVREIAGHDRVICRAIVCAFAA